MAAPFSYPGLWFLSGGDDESRSVAVRLPFGEGHTIGGVLHVINPAERARFDLSRSKVVREINDGSGDFAEERIVSDRELRGVRAVPGAFNQEPYWYLLRRSPPGLDENDLVARCTPATPNRQHWNCYMDVIGDDFVLQLSFAEHDLIGWERLDQSVRELIDSWRMGKKEE